MGGCPGVRDALGCAALDLAVWPARSFATVNGSSARGRIVAGSSKKPAYLCLPQSHYKQRMEHDGSELVFHHGPDGGKVLLRKPLSRKKLVLRQEPICSKAANRRSSRAAPFASTSMASTVSPALNHKPAGVLCLT